MENKKQDPELISDKMEQELADLGYDKTFRLTVTPAEAARIIEEQKIAGEKDQPDDVEESTLSEDEKEALRKKTQERIRSIGVIDVSKVAEAEARDKADENLSRNKEELAGVSGFFKKIWKYNLAREYYRQKEITKAKNDIFVNENLYGKNGDDVEHNMTMDAITDRFLSEYEGVIREDSGESKETFGGENDPEHIVALKEKIKNLVRSYASGKITSETFDTVRGRLLGKACLEGEDTVSKGKMYADNLREVADQVKAAVAHGVGLETLDLNFALTVGKAVSGVRTETNFSTVDKAIMSMQERFKGVPGMMVNETTVALAVILAKKKLRHGARLAGIGVAGFFGGVVALAAVSAEKENMRMKMDRAQHLRDRAKGKETPEGAKRREQLDTSVYEMQKAGDVSIGLESLIPRIQNLTFEEKNDAINFLGSVEARVRLSHSKRIDLISFSDEKKVEIERCQLEISLARAKALMKKQYGADFDELLDMSASIEITRLVREDVNEKDKVFAKVKRKAVIRAFFGAAVGGAIIGGAVQEGTAFFNKHVEGFAEHVLGNNHGAHGATPLEKLRQFISRPRGAEHAHRVPVERVLPDGTIVRLPPGMEIFKDGAGTVSISQGRHVLAGHVPFTTGKDGNLSRETIEALRSHHIFDNEQTRNISYAVPVTDTPHDYANKHPELFHHIVRGTPYDNNTLPFDKNELRMNLGMKDGKYTFDVHRMFAGGSYHGNHGINPMALAKEGKLSMQMSISQDTQNLVFSVPVNPDGTASVDPQSEIGKLLFGMDNHGNPVFKGRFAEVVHAMQGPDGQEHIREIATIEGDGISGIESVGTANDLQHVHDLRMPEQEIALPNPIPVMGRTPLERMKKNEDEHESSGNQEGVEDVDFEEVPATEAIAEPAEAVEGAEEAVAQGEEQNIVEPAAIAQDETLLQPFDAADSFAGIEDGASVAEETPVVAAEPFKSVEPEIIAPIAAESNIPVAEEAPTVAVAAAKVERVPVGSFDEIVESASSGEDQFSARIATTIGSHETLTSALQSRYAIVPEKIVEQLPESRQASQENVRESVLSVFLGAFILNLVEIVFSSSSSPAEKAPHRTSLVSAIKKKYQNDELLGSLVLDKNLSVLKKDPEISDAIFDAYEKESAFIEAQQEMQQERKDIGFGPLESYPTRFTAVNSGKILFSRFNLPDKMLNFSYKKETSDEGLESIKVLPTPEGWHDLGDRVNPVYGESFEFSFDDIKGKPVDQLAFKPALFSADGVLLQRGAIKSVAIA